MHSEMNNLVNLAAHRFIKMSTFLTIWPFRFNHCLPSNFPVNFLFFLINPNCPHEGSSFVPPSLSYVFRGWCLFSVLQFLCSSWSRLSILCHQGTCFFTSINNSFFFKKEDTTTQSTSAPFSHQNQHGGNLHFPQRELDNHLHSNILLRIYQFHMIEVCLAPNPNSELDIWQNPKMSHF